MITNDSPGAVVPKTLSRSSTTKRNADDDAAGKSCKRSRSAPQAATLTLLGCKSGEVRRQLILNPVDRTSYAIGRDNTKVDFVLDSSRRPGMISRVHATILSEGSAWRIRDSSTNGVSVNGKQLPRHGSWLLTHGDKVVFGENSADSEFSCLFEHIKCLRGAALAHGNKQSSLRLPANCKWHFFISHLQRTGGDQAHCMYLILAKRGWKVWYDNHQEKNYQTWHGGRRQTLGLFHFVSLPRNFLLPMGTSRDPLGYEIQKTNPARA